MLKTKTTITVIGTSTIIEDGISAELMDLTGTISEDGQINIYKYIKDENRARYRKNRTAANADYDAFENYVYSLADVRFPDSATTTEDSSVK